jgi:Serine protease inhibitor
MLYDLTNLRSKEYMDEDYYNPLRIANLLLMSDKLQANKDFAQIFADAYRGGVMRADFSSKEAVDVVNLWASEHTEGLIDNVLQELDPNAIYFSDRWSWEFDEESTKTDVFHAPNGDAEADFMLREGNQLLYFEDERAQAMPLSFKTGGAMYIILPKDGDTLGLMSALGEGYFSEICNDINGRTGKLLLPRFSMESDLKLADALTALGVPLFDAATAPLAGLVEGEAAFLSSAVQKAVIEVNEKGTTAAVTVMTAAGAGMPTPTEPFEMNCNRPFVFVLCGNTYDGGSQVLFTGILNRP